MRSIEAITRVTPCRQSFVRTEGIVTHISPEKSGFFLQKNGVGIYVSTLGNQQLSPGDTISVDGQIQCAGYPSIRLNSFRVLKHGTLPQPIRTNFQKLIQGRYDSVLVSIEGIVRSADISNPGDSIHRDAILHLHTASGPINVRLQSTEQSALNELLDSEVSVTGIAGASLNSKMERNGVLIYASTLDNIRVFKKATTDPWALALTPMEQIISKFQVLNFSDRVRVHGVITYQEPGEAVVLQNGNRSLWILTKSHLTLPIGSEADAIGFPALNNGLQILTSAELRPTGQLSSVTPQRLDWHELSSGRHSFDLVSVEGTVVMESGGVTQDEYVLASGGNRLIALYRHPSMMGATDPVRKIPVGSYIRATGICVQESAAIDNSSVPFSILMRSPGSIELLHGPSLISVRNLVIALLLVFFVLSGISIRFAVIERKVRRQIAALAYNERRRSHILEQINGDTPLAEIIEQTTELVSFRLRGAPCWVNINHGAQFGNEPEKLDGLRVHKFSILSHTGDSLGTISAAFDPHAKVQTDEDAALSHAAGLIELSIETRKLYSDLRHRSEFDQLTDVQNRFALENSLDELIRSARNSAGIFGILYLDLNEFKKVNDIYGHSIGDLYLQQVAARLKQQLRPGDVLSRMGGDEFVVLLPNVRNRSEVEEIAKRLGHCFDEVFLIGHYKLEGSASLGIAMYPEDARSRDSLLSAADTAMYAVKHTRQRKSAPPQPENHGGSVPFSNKGES